MTRLQRIILVLLIVIGFSSHMAIIVRYGNGTFGGNYRAHDETWHMALAQTAFRSFPFTTPIYANAPLTGYHYLSSMFMLPFLFLGIPVWIIFYWILPTIWFTLFVWLSWKLARTLRPSYGFALAYLFFNLFAGSFSFIIRLRNGVGLWDHTAFFMHQSHQYLMNFPLAWSILPILGILILLLKKPSSIRTYIVIGILAFVGYGLKFYAGVTISFLVGFFVIGRLFKKEWQTLWLLCIAIMASIGAIIFFYNPFSSLSTGSIFAFAPLATAHMTIEDKSYFYLSDIVLQRYYLYEHGIGPRLIAIESLTVLLTIFFSFGTRIIGVVAIVVLAIKNKMTAWYMSLIFTILMLILLSMTLVQKGDWFNTAQFASYAMLLMNVFAALTLYWIASIKRKIVAIFGVCIVILLTIHSSMDVINEYALHPKITYISSAEKRALAFLNRQPHAVVLTLPQKQLELYNPSDPVAVELWRSYDTAYVAAYSAKPLWFADRGQLAVTGVDYKKREQQLQNFALLRLKKTGAQYFYFIKKHPLATLARKKASQEKLNLLYDNEEVVIFSYPAGRVAKP